MKKRGALAALVCAAVLALALVLPASGSGTVYLMAVNDTVFKMTADNMPFLSGGNLYVPYTMLSSRDSGVSLGVEARYNASRGTVQVSRGGEGVTFDVRNNTAFDLQGNAVSVRAATRNSMAFLPLAWACDYFGTLDFTLNQTSYGVLVRVTNSSAVLSDAKFVSAADQLLRDNLDRYLRSVATPEPSATPSPTPTPTPTPTPSAPPATPEPSGPVLPDTEVIFGLRWGSRGEAAASALEADGARALFLFTEEELSAWDDAVRRLTAHGHTVGLVLTGETAEECLEEADRGRALLAHIARCDAQVVSAGALDREGRERLEESGLVVWRADVDGGGASSGTALLRLLDAGELNRVELTCSEAGLSALRGALSLMDRGGYQLRQATAPELASES